MILAEKEIRERGLIKSPGPNQFKGGTYNLRIGTVITSDGQTRNDTYMLKPREVAWVISREEVAIDDEVAGIAHIKTSLCNDGVLALNTGIIDPGWHGPLGTPLLNFGKASYPLRPDAEFLRLTFHPHLKTDVTQTSLTMQQYTEEKQDLALTRFGREFLDSDNVIRSALRKLVPSFIGYGSVIIAVLAIVLTFAAILINSAAFYSPTFFGLSNGFSDPRTENIIRRLEALEGQPTPTQ